ncbi:MAG: MaoC/PaaZ C-terminal domain-containing protein [Chloroflexota bacterium]
MAGKYFEEINVGDTFESPARTVTESDVIGFCSLSGDFNPLHTDEEWAKKTRWGSRIAHGMLGMAIALGLQDRLGLFDGTVVAMLGIEQWKFLGPIRIGDTIHIRLRITEKRETARPGQGVVGREMQIINQRGEVIQQGLMPVLMFKRPAAPETRR